MSDRVLSLLGLALRGGRLAVGEEPAALAARAGQARLLLLAADAAGNTLRRAEHLAQEGHCLFLTTHFSKAELGGALGRSSAAIVALTDTGLAAAVTERLALQDPERYGEAAARMDLKRRRAAERKTAPRRDPPPPEKRRPPSRRDGPETGQKGRPPRRNGSQGPGGHGRPYGGRPEGRRPHEGAPDRGRPGRPASASHGERPGKPAYGKPGGAPHRTGKHPEPGRGHPPKSRGGPGAPSGGRRRGGGR